MHGSKSEEINCMNCDRVCITVKDLKISNRAKEMLMHVMQVEKVKDCRKMIEIDSD